MLRSLCFLALGVCAAWAQDGAGIYKKRCAACHDTPAGRVPPTSALRTMSAEQILRSMESGVMKAQVEALSSGERHAIMIYLASPTPKAAATLASTANCSGRPQLLFLDEPTVGLDIQARELMWAMLRQLVEDGCSIVLTTHYLEEAESLADRVAVLAKGRMVAFGTVSEIRAHVVRKRISCSTTLAAEEVAAWPEVQSATRDQQRLHITASHAETVVRQLLAADEDLEELEVRRAGLAEAFTELTQEAVL